MPDTPVLVGLVDNDLEVLRIERVPVWERHPKVIPVVDCATSAIECTRFRLIIAPVKPVCGIVNIQARLKPLPAGMRNVHLVVRA